MSWKMVVWALKQMSRTDISATDKVVLMTLADRANKDSDHEAWPSREQIADDTGLHRNTIGRSIAALERAALVFSRRQRGANDRYSFNYKESTNEVQTMHQLGADDALDRCIHAPNWCEHIEEPRSEPRSEPRNLTKREDLILVAPSAAAPSAVHPDERPVISERDLVVGDKPYDFCSHDGTVLLSHEDLDQLQKDFPLVKNLRGMVRHWCREVGPTVRADSRQRQLLSYLERRQGKYERGEIGKRSVKPKEVPDDLYIDPYWPTWKKDAEIRKYWEGRNAGEQRSD